MVYRVFIDLETTGPGTSKFNDIIEIHAELQVNGAVKSTFNAQYSYTSSTVFSGGMNRRKAEFYKKQNKKSSKEGIVDFIN